MGRLVSSIFWWSSLFPKVVLKVGGERENEVEELTLANSLSDSMGLGVSFHIITPSLCKKEKSLKMKLHSKLALNQARETNFLFCFHFGFVSDFWARAEPIKPPKMKMIELMVSCALDFIIFYGRKWNNMQGSFLKLL